MPHYTCDDNPSLNLDEPTGRRDFDNATRTIVFTPEGPTSQTVQFPVFDDSINEETEGFIIVLDIDESKPNRGKIEFEDKLRTTLGRINDNDRK